MQNRVFSSENIVNVIQKLMTCQQKKERQRSLLVVDETQTFGATRPSMAAEWLESHDLKGRWQPG